MGVFIRLVMVIGKKNHNTLNTGFGAFHVLESFVLWSATIKRNVFCIFRIIYQAFLTFFAILN